MTQGLMIYTARGRSMVLLVEAFGGRKRWVFFIFCTSRETFEIVHNFKAAGHDVKSCSNKVASNLG